MATTMLHAIPKAATLVRRPVMSATAPPDSARMAMNAKNAGIPIFVVKASMVPKKPWPQTAKDLLRAMGEKDDPQE